MNKIKLSVACLILSCIACTKKPDNHFYIYVSQESPQISFGLARIDRALALRGQTMVLADASQADLIVHVHDSIKLEPEGFALRRDGERGLLLQANDAAGAMYGALELAEQIDVYGLANIEETKQTPHMRMRGTKFNIPLDVRTPSYTDASDPGQNNIDTVWDMAFWREYIDGLAQHRYNFISLWSLHPFPSLVKVPEYPDIALDDVKKSTGEWQEYYHLHGTGLDAPEIVDNASTIKHISIEEKIAFWQQVMAYAKTRNVQFYIITWNVFTNGIFEQYGITDDIHNPTTKDYFRKSIVTLLDTYPDLAGVGLTTGENMHGESFEDKEDWAFETYGQAVLDVVNKNPNRKVTFIHRQHFADPSYIEAKFKPLIQHDSVDFIYSFKYAKAHIHSAVEQPYHQKFVENIGDLETIWTMRNDSNYLFRWGAPDYMRTFLKNVPMGPTRGVYYGSDQWVWGRDFMSRGQPSDDGSPSRLEIDKHWYHWMQFGRLSYAPSLSNERFEAILARKFPAADEQALFSAWQQASMVYPITTGFHWGRLDFQWYIEGCKSRPNQAWNDTGFHDVNTFLLLPTHPMSGYQSIPDYVQAVKNDTTSKQTLKSPLAVAALLSQHAEEARRYAAKVVVKEGLAQQELANTLIDIRTMAFMADYYANKIEGSTYFALYLSLRNPEYRVKALTALDRALGAWQNYVGSAALNSKTRVWLNRVGIVDLEQTTEWVKKDIEIVRTAESTLAL